MILDQVVTSELTSAPDAAYHEKCMEIINFTTDCDNQEVIISVIIPFSGHVTQLPASSNALRVYLDGDAYYNYSYASYWNGELLLNSGTFTPPVANHPIVSVLSGVIRKTIAKAGPHTINVQSAGGTVSTVTTIKSQRRYQVWECQQ